MSNTSLNFNFFTIEDGRVCLNDNLAAITVFKRIITKYRLSSNSDGKLVSQIFGLIYYLGDPDSPANRAGESTKQAISRAVDLFGVNPELIKDELIIDAINFVKDYKTERVPSVKVYNELLKGLRTTSEVLQFINEQTADMVDYIKSFEGYSIVDESGEKIDKNMLIKQLTANIKELNNIGNTIPETFKTIDNVYQKMKTEESNSQMISGGKKLGNRANPRRDNK